MKLAVATCDPGPGLFGPILAVPSTVPPSRATTVSPGGDSIHTPLASSAVHDGSNGNVSRARVTSSTMGQTSGQSLCTISRICMAGRLAIGATPRRYGSAMGTSSATNAVGGRGRRAEAAGYVVRDMRPSDAADVGRVHVEVWRQAY